MIKFTDLQLDELKSTAVVLWWQARQTTEDKLIRALESIAQSLSSIATGRSSLDAIKDTAFTGLEQLLAGIESAHETAESTAPTQDPTAEDWRKSAVTILWLLTAKASGKQGTGPELKKACKVCKKTLIEVLLRGMRS